MLWMVYFPSGEGHGGKLTVPGHPTLWMIVGHTALAVDADRGCLDIFTLVFLSSLSPPLWETTRIKTEILSQRAVKSKTTNQPFQESPGSTVG